MLNWKGLSDPKYVSCAFSNDNSCKKDLYDTRSSDEFGVLESTELLRSKRLESLHLTFNLEAGSLLPLAIRCVGNWVMYIAQYVENATHVDYFVAVNDSVLWITVVSYCWP